MLRGTFSRKQRLWIHLCFVFIPLMAFVLLFYHISKKPDNTATDPHSFVYSKGSNRGILQGKREQNSPNTMVLNQSVLQLTIALLQDLGLQISDRDGQFPVQFSQCPYRLPLGFWVYFYLKTLKPAKGPTKINCLQLSLCVPMFPYNRSVQIYSQLIPSGQVMHALVTIKFR